MDRRNLLCFLLMLANARSGWAAPASTYAFVTPEQADGLAQRERDAPAAAMLRAAARVVDRAPHALPLVHVEGTLPGHGIYDSSREALRDLPAARDLAIAGRLTGDLQCSGAAARFVSAWATTYTPSLNPIDETGFDALFMAWDLLPDTIREPLQPAMEKFLRAFALGYLQHPPKGSTAVNNWNSHRVKLATMAAFAGGDERLVAHAHDRYREQLQANIDSNGLTFDFSQRDALHYVVYSLEPLLMAALAARQHGQDWWPDEGQRLSLALDWLLPYATGKKTHIEFANTTVQFDRVRRDAGLQGFDGMFDPKVARLAYALAARLDMRYAELAQSLKDAPWQDAWLELVVPLARR